MVEIAQANMANAVRSVSIWKGLDPRDLTLVAFGGAGGMVAGEVARALDIPRVLVPVLPGNTCAMGLLMTDLQEDAAVAFLCARDAVDLDALNARLGAPQRRSTPRSSAQGVAGATSFCRTRRTSATTARSTSCASRSSPSR